LVRRFWQLQDKPDKQIIIARKNAYHGSTIAAASLGGMEGMHTQGAGIPIPNIIHIAQPYWFQEGRDIDPNTFGIAVAEELEKAIDHHGIDKIAAFIAEPIQGAGGVIIPPETYWPAIQRICDDNEILLVADEVVTGFGRLGEWFGSTTYEIKPDLIAFAKGVTSGYLPLGGVLVNDKVADTIIAKGGEFTHGFTYSGHPVSCAVAIANIKILAEDKVIDQVKNHTAPYLAKRWQSLIDHPIVGEARARGLVAALEICKDKNTGTRFAAEQNVGSLCRDLAIENGLVLRAVGDTMIIAPPLIITHEQIDELITKAISTLDATAAAVQRI
jgi:putrescine aminotransferase